MRERERERERGKYRQNIERKTNKRRKRGRENEREIMKRLIHQTVETGFGGKGMRTKQTLNQRTK